MFLVIPNYIADAINARLDAELEKHPEAAADRELFYGQLIDHVNRHGTIPDFSLEKKS